MKIRVIAFLCVALIALQAEAANYTVKSAGGGNFSTIQACVNAMTSGDTCTVFAGTYNEQVTVPAGAVAAYKTIQVNGDDLVIVTKFTLNSHIKLIGGTIPRPTSTGLHVQNPSVPTTSCVDISPGATDVLISNTNFYACGSNGMVQSVNATPFPSYVTLRNNRFSYSCSTSNAPNICTAIFAEGDHWLIEGNDLSHVLFSVNRRGSFGVVRNNTQHDTLKTDCILASNGGRGGNCHFDFFFSEPSGTTQFNLVEGNTITNSIGDNNKGFLAQGDICNGQCSNLIVRFNVINHLGSGVLDDSNAFKDITPGFFNVKSYNNTWADVISDPSNHNGSGSVYIFHSTGGAEINNLYLFNFAATNVNPYFCDSLNTNSSTCSTFTPRNNLAWCTSPTCVLHARIYSTGRFTDDPGNIQADPLFVNYAGGDLSLSDASPAIGAGSFLTAVAAGDPGTGTNLLVNDAGFFQDGSGIAGVKADQIRVGTTTVVQIVSINYATNTITLAKSINRSPGNPVYLFSDSSGRVVLFGNNPDIGARPFGQQPPLPPVSLTVTVS